MQNLFEEHDSVLSDSKICPVIFYINEKETDHICVHDMLKDCGYRVYFFRNEEEALEKIGIYNPDMFMLEINMPSMKGFQAIKALKNNDNVKEIPVVFVSSSIDKGIISSAFKLGASDFIRKPLFKEELAVRIGLHLENIKNRNINNIKINIMRERLNEQIVEIRNIKTTTIFSLAKLAESRDPETGLHLERIREYVKILAQGLDKAGNYKKIINEEYIYNMYNMSVLHDIGKVGIPDSILLKKGKLTPIEFDIMKTHTLIGGNALETASKITKNSTFLEMGRDIALYHHEKWNGNGYPCKLDGKNIPLSARIIAIADVFDAISFKRVYRENILSDEEIDKIMAEECGVIFDPDLFLVFYSLKPEFNQVKKHFCN